MRNFPLPVSTEEKINIVSEIFYEFMKYLEYNDYVIVLSSDKQVLNISGKSKHTIIFVKEYKNVVRLKSKLDNLLVKIFLILLNKIRI